MMATELANLIEAAIASFERNVQRPDEDAVQALVASGIPRIRAEKLVAVVPLAFGRVLLHHSGFVAFANDVVVRYDHDQEHRRELRKEPIFVAAAERAMQMFHSGPRHSYEATCLRSSEMQALNEAFAAGHTMESLKDATFQPVHVIRLTVDEWDAEPQLP